MKGQMNKMETWVDIIGYEDLYQISNYGRIMAKTKIVNGRLYNQKIMSLLKDKNGYSKIKLQKDCVKKQFYINRLVAIHFIENKENLSRVHHIDNDITNNNVDNLKWSKAKSNFPLNCYKGGNGKSNITILLDEELKKEIVFKSQKEALKFLNKEKSYFSFMKKYKKTILFNENNKQYKWIKNEKET